MLASFKEYFSSLGQQDAYASNPTKIWSEAEVDRRASRIAHHRLRAFGLGDVDPNRAFHVARGAYIDGWYGAQRQMSTVPHLRTISQVWTIGYRSAEDRMHLAQLFDPANEQSACRLLVDIRYRPASPFQPVWSRKQLQEQYRHQYRYVHELGNQQYARPEAPISLVDEAAGLACLVYWLQAGWDLILLCACEHVDTCHRTLVAQRLAEHVQGDPRIMVHSFFERL